MPEGADSGEYLNTFARNTLITSHGIPSTVLDLLEAFSGKPILEFTDADFSTNSPLLIGADPFSTSMVDLFLSYYSRLRDNTMYRWQSSIGEQPLGTPLTPEEFEKRNGPPPWELLSSTLQSIGMRYEFNRPEANQPNLSFEVLLKSLDDNTTIRLEQLSSGERTLLAVARSLYMGSHMQYSFAMPKVLLLDEPDASLHPSMVSTLLSVVKTTFVDDYGTKVIMTTHSPTTVALAPEESLYVMQRDGCSRLSKATRDEALKGLLIGLPTLSVSNDNRRVVVTEAEDDAECYQDLFTILRPSISTPISLMFVPSGSTGNSNRHEVLQMVSNLRRNGTNIRGVVDRDADASNIPDGVVFAPTRYSLENLILDPVAVGILLVREEKASAIEVFGTDAPFFSFDAKYAQHTSDYVMAEVRSQMTEPQRASLDHGRTVTISYNGGAAVTAPWFALNYDGHAWEAWLLGAFKGLSMFKGKLKQGVVRRVYRDMPQWIPTETVTLFSQLLTADPHAR